MSFVTEFNSLPLDVLVKRSLETSSTAARQLLTKDKLSLADFAALISPAAAGLLEPLSRRSQQVTQQRFGKVIRLFAPLYLSNECINCCAKPKRRNSGATVTAVTWPCQCSPLPSACLVESQGMVILTANNKEATLYGCSFNRTLPKMYAITCELGASATVKYSGQVAKYCM